MSEIFIYNSDEDDNEFLSDILESVKSALVIQTVKTPLKKTSIMI